MKHKIKMKRISYLFLLLTFTVSITQAQVNHYSPNKTNNKVEKKTFLHTVKRGEDLTSIAASYQLEKKDIILLNPGCDEMLYAGQTLRIPQKTKNLIKNTSPKYHTIQKGETLYRLTQIYHITAETICKANPGLSAQNFKAGQVIVIPTVNAIKKITSKRNTALQQVVKTAQKASIPCRKTRKVKRRDTVSKLCKKYKITPAQLYAANPNLKHTGLVKGSKICIPYSDLIVEKKEKKQVVQKTVTPPTNQQLFHQYKPKAKRNQKIKVAFMLPFLLDEAQRGKEVPRMVEFYEGAMIAIDSLKHTGISFEIHTFDTGTAKNDLDSLLSLPDMRNLDLIIGGLYPKHIQQLSTFTKRNKIKLVVPFSSKVKEVFNHPSMFLINTPQSYLFSEVYEHFTRLFPNANVIFIQSSDKYKVKKGFIKGLKHELDQKHISYKNLNYNATIEEYTAAIQKEKDNIVILTSAAEIALNEALPTVSQLVLDNPETTIRLFGYPEWQTYTLEHLSLYYKIGTYFYSSFYTNHLFSSAKKFNKLYRNWYGREMMNTYPKFGMLGFDTTYYFLKAFANFGNRFDEHINKIEVTPVQTGFKFQRVNNWGGFVNKKEFFIYFTRQFEVKKLNFDYE
jgi:LysM repeat protein